MCKKDPAGDRERKVATGPNFFSIEREMALGQQLALEVEKQAKLYQRSIVTEYVNRLSAKSGPAFRCQVSGHGQSLAADSPDAFSLPGRARIREYRS